MARKMMSNTLAIGLALGVFAGAAGAQVEPAEWRDNSMPDLRENWVKLEGKPAPTLAKLEGWLGTKARSWEDYRGKVVMIDYWATWCGPCVAGIPHVKEMYEKYHDKGLEILGVHSSRGFEKMPAFAEENQLPYGLAADPTRDLGTALGIKFIPCYFIIDRKGTLRVAGANREKLDDIVTSILAEPYEAPSKSLAQWPPYVEKKLYANDIRGQKGPELIAAEWLTDKPETEGKVVLVDFWATWCPPCRGAIPHMNEYQAKFKDDLVVIGLSSDEKIDTVREFMKTTKMDYAQAADPEKRTSKAIGVSGIPHVIIMSSDGIVRWQGFPGSEEEPLTEAIIEQIINADPAVAARRAAKEKTASATSAGG